MHRYLCLYPNLYPYLYTYPGNREPSTPGVVNPISWANSASLAVSGWGSVLHSNNTKQPVLTPRHHGAGLL